MKTRHIFAASVLFAVSASSFAQSSGSPDRVNSRYPDVQDTVAAPVQARASQGISRSAERINSRYPEAQQAEPAKTRAEVQHELEQAKADGSYDALRLQYRG